MGHAAHTVAVSAGWPALDVLVCDVLTVRRQIAVLQARESQLLADAVELVAERVAERRASGRRVIDRELPLREVSAELGAAMRVSDRTVQGRMGDAAILRERFPATLAAWRAGRIDAGHVSVILDAGAAVGEGALRGFEERVLDAAGTESPTRLRPLAQAIAAQLDPEAAASRQQRALADRRIRVLDLGDGAGRFQLDSNLVLVRAVEDRLTQMARALVDVEPATADTARDDTAGADDQRTLDQRRADIAADLLLAGAPAAHGDGDALAGITATVQITVPVLTLAGVRSEPALLSGDGPIDADTARALAAAAPGWDRVLTHPYTGAVLAVDRYRPSNDLRRFLRARDEHCRFPGCRRSPVRCDIDHTIDAARAGSTDHRNLAHLCRRHHTLKHASTWTVRQLGGGVLEWTSPTGRAHRDRPPSTVRFVPTDWSALARAGAAAWSADDPPPF